MGAHSNSPKSSLFDDANSIPLDLASRFWGAIDKLDLRLPSGTQLRPAVAAFINESKDTEGSTRRINSRYYAFVSDLRPMRIDARIHVGLKHLESHTGEGKLELIDTGTKSLREITAEIMEVIDYSPVDLEIMRIDLCADMYGIPMEWFLNRARVKFKRIAREIAELKAERIGKVGIQTLTAG